VKQPSSGDLDAAIDAGRRAGLWTVAGVGTANGLTGVALLALAVKLLLA